MGQTSARRVNTLSHRRGGQASVFRKQGRSSSHSTCKGGARLLNDSPQTGRHSRSEMDFSWAAHKTNDRRRKPPAGLHDLRKTQFPYHRLLGGERTPTPLALALTVQSARMLRRRGDSHVTKRSRTATDRCYGAAGKRC